MGNLGVAYLDLGETDVAIDMFLQRLDIARKISDSRGEASALGNLGNAYQIMDEPRRAIEYSQQCREKFRAIGDHLSEGISNWNMALIYHSMGDEDESINHAESALPILDQFEHPDASEVRESLEEWRREAQGNLGV